MENREKLTENTQKAKLTNLAVGCMKSAAFASPFEPIGPSSGSSKCRPNTSRTYPRADSSTSIENFIPRLAAQRAQATRARASLIKKRLGLLLEVS